MSDPAVLRSALDALRETWLKRFNLGHNSAYLECADELDRLITALPAPSLNAPLCADGDHDFRPCAKCGMPHLASQLEPPTEDDIAWAKASLAADLTALPLTQLSEKEEDTASRVDGKCNAPTTGSTAKIANGDASTPVENDTMGSLKAGHRHLLAENTALRRAIRDGFERVGQIAELMRCIAEPRPGNEMTSVVLDWARELAGLARENMEPDARAVIENGWPRDAFGIHVFAPDKCTCWVGRGEMGGDAAERNTCSVHGSENEAGSTHEEWQRDSHS